MHMATGPSKANAKVINTSGWTARDIVKEIIERDGMNTNPTLLAAMVIAEAGRDIAHAVTRVAHGDVHGPAGLEALGMCLAGDGMHRSVAESLDGVASALGEIANKLPDA